MGQYIVQQNVCLPYALGCNGQSCMLLIALLNKIKICHHMYCEFYLLFLFISVYLVLSTMHCLLLTPVEKTP